MIAARILTEYQDQIRVLEVGETHGSLSNSNGFVQPRTTALMTHVRAIGQVVRTQLTSK